MTAVCSLRVLLYQEVSELVGKFVELNCFDRAEWTGNNPKVSCILG